MSRLELLSPAGLRQDNRRPYELRQTEFSIPLNPPAGADGASSVAHGLTRVNALVFGPRESRGGGTGGGVGHDQANINVEISMAAFSGQDRRKVGKGDKRSVEMAEAITNTFKPVVMRSLYPRSTIDIYIEVLQQDGGVLQAAINATTLALIAAGVSLTDYIAALSVASLSSPPCPLLDVSQTEESDLPHLTVATLPRSSKITLVQMEARLSVERFNDILRLGVEGCQTIKGELEREVARWTKTVTAASKASQFAAGSGTGGARLENAMEDD